MSKGKIGISKKSIGVLLMLLFAFSYSAMQVAVKKAGPNVPMMMKVLVRNVMNMSVIFCFVKAKGVSCYGEKKFQKSLLARDLFSFLGMTTLFYASTYAACQGDITVLHKMSPFFITILACLFLGEKLSKIQIPALLLAGVGAFLVANPKFNSDVTPLVVAFCSALATSCSYTLLSYFKDKVNGLTVIMHFTTFCVVASVCILTFGTYGVPYLVKAGYLAKDSIICKLLCTVCGKFFLPKGWALVYLLLGGLFGTIGQTCATYAYRFAPASEISIYNYSGVIFSMILGCVIAGDKIRPNSIIGGALVIGAAVMVFIYNNKVKSKKVDESPRECAKSIA